MSHAPYPTSILLLSFFVLAVGSPALVKARQAGPSPTERATRAPAAEDIGDYAGVYRLSSGAFLVVEPAGRWLTVEAVGQEAVDVLAFQAPAERTQLERHNAEARALLAGIGRGDYRQIRARMLASQREQGAADLERYFRILDEAYGKMRGFDVLGSLPRGGGITHTFVRIRYQTEVCLLRFLWYRDDLVTVRKDLPEPFRVLLQPAAPGRFVRTDLPSGAVSWMVFQAHPEGGARTLTLQYPGGSVTAERDGLTAEAR